MGVNGYDTINGRSTIKSWEQLARINHLDRIDWVSCRVTRNQYQYEDIIHRP